MAFHPLTQRHVGGFLLSLGLVALLAGCDDGPSRVAGPNYSLDGDAGTQCKDEGCACEPGTEPESCLIGTPIVRGNQYLCQRGTRVCRDGAWSACENITLYAPSGEKLLGQFGALEACRPDDFVQTSTPNQTDLGTLGSTNLEYVTTPTPGVTIVQIPTGTIPNYGLGADNDGDGVPDAVGIDDCLNDPLHWRAPCTGPTSGQGFFHILLPGQTAQDPMSVSLQVRSVDTYILIDTTKSMDGEIANLRSGISGLMSNIRTVIPDANLGLGVYRDLPVYADSNMNDLPFMHLLDPTSSLSSAQSLVNEVVNIDGNYFWPEAGANALYSVATGNGMGPWLPNRTCSNGGTGYPCFRAGTVPVVIMVTDAPSWLSSSGLSYAPYAGTAGATAMAGTSLPRATTTSTTGQAIRSNDTEATAFTLGDLTNSSVTVIGSNDGITTPLSNNFNATCGGRALNGPDVFYTFTLSDYRNFVIEAFGDFDPAIWLREVRPSPATTENLACDLDSGRLNDANGTAVWRTGARLTTATIPGTGSTTTTDVTFSGCQGASSSATMTMTGCNVATTTNADLSGCTVPSTTASTNFTGCQIASSTTTATMTGCSVPSTTTVPLSGCQMDATTTTSNFTGCTLVTANTSALSNCSVNTTTPSTNLSGCVTGSRESLSGCSQLSANLTGCYTSSETPQLDNCEAVDWGTTSYASCTPHATIRTRVTCTVTNGSWYDPNGYAVTGGPTGSVIPDGTLVTSTSSSGKTRTINLSQALPGSSTSTFTLYVRWARTLRHCDKEHTTDSDPSIGWDPSGDDEVDQGQTIVGTYWTGSDWTIVLSADAGSDDDNMAPISVGPDYYLPQLRCSSDSGAYTIPSGTPITGTGIPTGTTISSEYWSGGRWKVNLSATPTSNVTSATYSYPNFFTCTGYSGSGSPATGTTLVGTGLASGSTISWRTTSGGNYIVQPSSNLTGTLSSTVYVVSPSATSSTLTCSTVSGSALANGMTLAGTGLPTSPSRTITSFIGSGTTGPVSITMSGNSTAQVSTATASSASTFGNILTCNTLGAFPNNTAPAVGMTLTGTGVGNSGSTVIDGVTGSGPYVITMRHNATAAISSATGSQALASFNTFRNCALTGGNPVPTTGMSLTGTNLPAGATISSIPASAPYTIVMSASTTNSGATLTSTYSSTPVLNRFINCTIPVGSTAPTAAAMNLLGGTSLGTNARVSAVTGSGTGPYTITTNPTSMNSSATLTSYEAPVAQLNRLTGCVVSSGTFTSGMTVAGTNIPASTTAAILSGAGTVGSPYSFSLSANASATGSVGTVTATSTTYDTLRFSGCVPSDASALTSGMVLTGVNLNAGGATIAGYSPTGGGAYTITMSAAAATTTATLASASLTTNFLDRLTNCSLVSGSIVPGMGITGTRLAANTTISSYSGTGPYTIMLSQNATSVGATTATGLLLTPLPQLTGCQGSGVLADGLEITGTPVVAGSTITSFGGLGTAVDPWTINLSATPTTTGTNLTLGALVPGPTNRLTGCMIATGGPVIGPATSPAHPGMAMSGALIVGGSTISSFTGSGSGPYDIVLDTNLLGVGATDATGTITLTSGTGSLMFGSVGMPPGTYQIVVDSTSFNAPDSSSAGRGVFQLRMTNQNASANGSLATTARTDTSWATTTAALTSAGIRTIGIASCPMSCTDLDAKQTAYETCVQGSPATNTGSAAADRIGITTSRCGAAYARCITEFGVTAATSCTTMFTECRNSEIGAGKQSLNVATLACSTAASACNRLNSGQTTKCASVQSACSGASNVCTTQYTAVQTCLATAGTGIGDDYRFCDETRADLSAMGTATGSVRADGTPFVYQISPNGSGLTSTIADAVRELAQYILFDVTAQCEPAGSLACTGLFRNALVGTPNPVGLTPGCTSCTGPTCFSCNPGTAIGYNINFENSGVPRSSVPQIFDFDIVLRDQNGLEMSRAPVRIVVPPDEVITYPASGSFEQIYDSTLQVPDPAFPNQTVGCDYPGRRADWSNFTYTAVVPAGTSIAFQFRTADTISGLATAPAVTHTITADATNAIFDVGAAFDAASATNSAISNYKPYMSITTVLYSSSARTAAPTMQTYTAEFVCVDAE